jgi:voltage-gated potassium channel
MTTSKRLIIGCCLMFAVGAIAVIGYRIIGGPNVSLLDAMYMAVVTLSGVGYGEIIDSSRNHALRTFNMFIVLIGVAVAVYVFSQLTAFLVEGELRHLFRRNRMKKHIADLRQHYIVCGLGETGRHVVDELLKTQTPFVVIENSVDAIARLKDSHDERYNDLLYVTGDATDEKMLEQAGIDVAAGLISVLPSDKDNLVIVVVVRQRNPAIRIVSRCTDLSYAERMVKAGANSTVSPNHIGGLRMASELLRPAVVGFLDLMLKEKSRTLRVEEIALPVSSSWAGKTLADLNLNERFNLLPLAVKHPGQADEQLVVNPRGKTTVAAGAVIIVLGDSENLGRARADAGR